MPLHFNSFIADNEEQLKTKLLSDIIEKYTEVADKLFVNEDKTKIHMTSYFKDVKTKKNVGKVVITLLVRKDYIELVDEDIVLLSDKKVKLHFDEKLEQSSDANEYYLVHNLDKEKYFNIETVCRFCIKEELEGCDKEVYLSAFPFQLDLFETEEEMNVALGTGKEVNIPKIGKKFITVDPEMMCDGRILTELNEPSSFILGKIKNFNDVEVDIAGNIIKFKIINLETGIGNMPVAVHEENFDLSKLKKNVFLGMLANVKVDLGE